MKVLIFGGGSDMAAPLVDIFPDAHLCTRDVRRYWEIENEILRVQPAAIVNLAGVSYVQRIVGAGVRRWQEELETNLAGSFHIARAAVTHRGSIPLVFVASVAGLYGKGEHSGYSASKAGVISLVQSLGMEGHKAYAVSPGRVDTKMRERDYPGEDPRTRLTPTQVAEVIRACIKGEYNPGDNIIIRKIGFETFLRVDDGEPWKGYLNVRAC